jgi:catechol 2,3-dioxygenase-like lactoylglutathione lyase family enzyme
MTMDMKLEVVVLPVSDVDRAKRFYENLGFRVDIDVAVENYRALQMTPPGSEASIIFGKGVTSAQPGSVDRLLLAVYDIDETRRELVSQGVEVSEVFHDENGGLGAGFRIGTAGRAPGPDPQRRSYGSYASFSDPDGNVWLLQEIKERLPGRTTQKTLNVNGKASGILLDALKAAATAHGVHEKELGRPDPDWPQWYAEHMKRTLGGAGYQLTQATSSVESN